MYYYCLVTLAACCSVALALATLVGCASSRDRCVTTVAPQQPQARNEPGTVLFVVSAAGEQTLRNGKTRATGYFLSEFFGAYKAVTAAGFAVVFATVEGKPAVVDPESLQEDYWKDHPSWRAQAQALVATDRGLAQPLSTAEALRRADDFDGVVVPGGQGTMIDLIDDPALAELLVRHGETGRAVGLICHAPALLAHLPNDNPFVGRSLTSVSAVEEFYIERVVMKGRAQDRGIGAQLRKKGYRHRTSAPGKSRAVRDGNLVTSQNPFSGDAFNNNYLAALTQRDAQHSGQTCQPR